MPRKPLDNEFRHVRLICQVSTILQSQSLYSAWGMPVMPVDMPVEAHCQEDRGINAERMNNCRTWSERPVRQKPNCKRNRATALLNR